MIHRRIEARILIAGAGPAGMSAAWAAAESGLQATMIDNNPAPGGQIWRGSHGGNRLSEKWFARLRQAGPARIQGARIVSADAGRRELLVELRDGAVTVAYEKLIIATGARERFLPFPGWTLPGVMGVGAIQALVKTGMDVRGKRFVLAGSGPLLLAVADVLREKGASVLLIAEQASRAAVDRFVWKLLAHPTKLAEGLALRSRLLSIPYLTDCWVESCTGGPHLREVRVNRKGWRWNIQCDFLGTGYGLVPGTELAALLGCETTAEGVTVDNLQKTTLDDIYCAGEAAGVGGCPKALSEGAVAGFSAAGKPERAASYLAERDAQRKFAALLASTFTLRDELRGLPQPETIVCRCEDVRHAALDGLDGWREAKLQSRCGMGLCQGRVCGSAIEFLNGWHPASVRPPLFPARVGTLMTEIEERP